MSPEDRRAAIVTAAFTLVEHEGIRVSTKKIAEAAGIAEGTLFRVFPTKTDLIKAVVMRAMDPTDTLDRLERIDRALPVEERISQVIAIVQGSVHKVRSLMMIMRQTVAEYGRKAHSWGDGGTTMHPHHEALSKQPELFRIGVEKVLESSKDDLTVDPSTAASFILVSSFVSSAFPEFVSHQPDSQTLTSLVVRALTNGKDPR